MVDLAHALGAAVTAEGIETAGQLAWLRGMGIERGQGYHFAPPLPAEEFARLLTRDEAYDLGPAPAAGRSPIGARGRRTAGAVPAGRNGRAHGARIA